MRAKKEKAKDRVITALDKETREKLDYICKRDKRAMSNMVLFLIDDYYNRVTEKTKENVKDFNYEEFLKLQGSGWDGDLEKSRANREFK